MKRYSREGILFILQGMIKDHKIHYLHSAIGVMESNNAQDVDSAICKAMGYTPVGDGSGWVKEEDIPSNIGEGCKRVKKEGESCPLNNECKYPECTKENETSN